MPQIMRCYLSLVAVYRFDQRQDDYFREDGGGYGFGGRADAEATGTMVRSWIPHEFLFAP